MPSKAGSSNRVPDTTTAGTDSLSPLPATIGNRPKVGRFRKFVLPLTPVFALVAFFAYLWFVTGVLESRETYPDGRPKAAGYVKRHGLGNYVREGHWVSYHENGEKASQGYYKGGKKTGEWHYWDEQGRPLSDAPPIPETVAAGESGGAGRDSPD